MADQRKPTIVTTTFTGPGLDRPQPRSPRAVAKPHAPTATKAPSGASARPPAAIPFDRTPDRAASILDPLNDDAALDIADPVSVPLVMRRLSVAAIIIAALSVLFWVVLPAFGLVLHPILPATAIVAIAIGTLLNASDADADRAEDANDACCSTEEGKAVGCCSGPRPPSFLRK